MPAISTENPLVIAVSSRALFHIEDGDQIFQNQSQEAFDRYMLEKENEPLRPGSAFPLIRKFLDLNPPDGPQLVKVMLLSRNSPEAGVRIMKSVEHYNLPLESAVFSRGMDRLRYAAAIGAHLFLSANASDVKRALEMGITAATVHPTARPQLDESDKQLRIAIDGDAVIFDSESDNQYRKNGMPGFNQHELEHRAIPLGPGPFKPLLEALVELREQGCPILLGLFTARGMQAHWRVVSTLRKWGIVMDVTAWAGGHEKGPLLKGFGPDVMFDDSRGNIDSAVEHGVCAGHVPVNDYDGIVANQHPRQLTAA